jgi:hypothetical protein
MPIAKLGTGWDCPFIREPPCHMSCFWSFFCLSKVMAMLSANSKKLSKEVPKAAQSVFKESDF